MDLEICSKSGFKELSAKLLAISYKIASCAVKLFVAATPISGPQLRPTECKDMCTRDEVMMFTIDVILVPLLDAVFTVSSTSALSPLWDKAIRTELSSK